VETVAALPSVYALLTTKTRAGYTRTGRTLQCRAASESPCWGRRLSTKTTLSPSMSCACICAWSTAQKTPQKVWSNLG